mmetsp:Transcript_18973/g.54383  ORF Transcript_18973/g.54383 Transcript_18973/m.54383 type:complete len:131 (-) Transcript_18973:679-1071(-)
MHPPTPKRQTYSRLTATRCINSGGRCAVPCRAKPSISQSVLEAGRGATHAPPHTHPCQPASQSQKESSIGQSVGRSSVFNTACTKPSSQPAIHHFILPGTVHPPAHPACLALPPSLPVPGEQTNDRDRDR